MPFSKHALRLWAATCHAPELETARVTRFTAGADEPYEGILHVRVCGGRRGQPRLLPGTEPPFAPLVCLGVSVSFVSSWRSVSFVVSCHRHALRQVSSERSHDSFCDR